MRRRLWQKLMSARQKCLGLWSDRKGVTAIEFSMIALPFFVLAFGIIEVGFAHFANRMVDNAVISASRLIRTGQVDQGKMSAAEFKTQICGFMPAFMCSQDRIFVDVTAVDTFSAAGNTDGLYEDGELKDEFNFLPGDASSIVVVNVVYKWPMMTAAMGLDFADKNGDRHLTSTMVFKNEPYE